MNSFRKSLTLLLITFFTLSAFAQEKSRQLEGTAFEEAGVRWKNDAPSDIRLQDNRGIAAADFFTEYKKAFGLSTHDEFKAYGKNLKKGAMSDKRYKQYFHGLEIAETHLILHSKNQQVVHANGNPVHNLKLSVEPTLNLEQASFYLDKLFTGFVATHKKDKSIKFLPVNDLKDPQLMISAGTGERKLENFKLVYRFDIYFPKSHKRYDIDLDAHTGSLIGKLPRSYEGNIETRGLSLYNDTVNITVMDEEYLSLWDPSSWHLNDWSAYEGTGSSWWIADTLVGSSGGYRDAWLQALVTEEISLEAGSPVLTFYHRYAVEEPSKYESFDAWDGMNVQISTDDGENWSVLQNPSPAYDRLRLYSFSFHGQGDTHPGWCGTDATWTQVTVPLADYAGSTVKIRFIFAADGAYSTIDEDGLFGWQIDNIRIGSSFENDGTDDNMSEVNITSSYVSHTEGNYRLRETSRGAGIATFDGSAIADNSYMDAVDYVEDDSLFYSAKNQIGVSVQWALQETYDYYYEHHDRSSYDGNGGLLRAYTGLLFDGSPNNAAYIGGGQMLYGDGDGNFYGPVVSIDVTAHELTHGVTGASANLIYRNESGALNESFSDVFGKTVEFTSRGIVDDWLLGDDIAINASPFRSMSNPNLRNDPDTYLGDYWVTTNGLEENDWGGVHTNNGVMNYWYYLLCEGGSGTNDDGFEYNVTAIDMEDAAQIAYRNLTAYLIPSSEFAEAAAYSVQCAVDLFGEGSQQQISVMQAWDAVGVYMDPHIIVQESLALNPTSATVVQKSLTINNKSASTLEITRVTLSGDGFGFANFPNLPMNIEKTGTIDLEYDPSVHSGPSSGTLSLYTNDPDNSLVSIALTSEGYNALPDQSAQANFSLNSIYPNPFSEKLHIAYYLPKTQFVHAVIMNPLGEKLSVLVHDDVPAGQQMLEWDGITDAGEQVPAGNYILMFYTEDQQISRVVNRY